MPTNLIELYEKDSFEREEAINSLSDEEILEMGESLAGYTAAIKLISDIETQIIIEEGKGVNINLWIALYKKFMRLVSPQKTQEKIDALKENLRKEIKNFESKKFPDFVKLEKKRQINKYPTLDDETITLLAKGAVSKEISSILMIGHKILSMRAGV